MPRFDIERSSIRGDASGSATPCVASTQKPGTPLEPDKDDKDKDDDLAFTIMGTLQIFSEYKAPPSEAFTHDTNRLTVTYTMKRLDQTRVAGAAELTFVNTHRHRSQGCDVDRTSGLLRWTASLDGEYQRFPDGTLRVSAPLVPTEGPSYDVPLDCLEIRPQKVKPAYPLIMVELKDGRSDLTTSPVTGIGPTSYEAHAVLCPPVCDLPPLK